MYIKPGVAFAGKSGLLLCTSNFLEERRFPRINPHRCSRLNNRLGNSAVKNHEKSL
jgi:hypothetical protein